MSERTVQDDRGSTLLPVLLVGVAPVPALHLAPPSPFQVNLLLALGTLLTLVHPFLVYRDCQRKEGPVVTT